MNAVILTIGTEILMGELLDTNSVYLANELPKYGITLKKSVSIGDNLNEIEETLRTELKTSDIIITTGGLGPTSDDLTREAIAGYCQEEMSVDGAQLDTLTQLFKNRDQQMPSTNLKQACLIPSATGLPNSYGTAPGWLIKKNNKIIVAMPGPPAELKYMWNNHVVPTLTSLTDGDVFITRNIKSFGISEGELDERFSHLFGIENPFLGIYSKQDGIHLRLIAHAKDNNSSEKLIEPVEKEITDSIGKAIWGFDEDTPAQKLIDLLTIRNFELHIKENFTKGVIASNLSETVGDNKAQFESFIPTESNEPYNCGESNSDKTGTRHIILIVDHIQDAEKNTLVNTVVKYGNISTKFSVKFRQVTMRIKQRVANQAILKTIEFINSLT